MIPTASPADFRVTLDVVRGCLLGLALGDALGAPHEGGLLERLVWRVVGRTRLGERRWTDDTQMTLDVVESLLARGAVHQDDLARRFARSQHWSRGYGPGAARVLGRIRRGDSWEHASRSVYPEGSFGNGAAMRAPILGVVYACDAESLDDAVTRSAVITHAHPLAIEGALIVARATAAAAMGLAMREHIEHAADGAALAPYRARLRIAADWLSQNTSVPIATVRDQLGNGIAAVDSCVTALYLAVSRLDSPFMTLHEAAVALGGDVDTISAMAGAIWGARHGGAALPAEPLASLEDRDRLERLASDLARIDWSRSGDGPRR